MGKQVSGAWAPLVFGRTLEADFRFLAVPRGFDIRWAEPYLLATTSVAEKLSGAPRWSLFQDERFRVVGLTCTALDLVGRGSPYTRDGAGRPIFLFAAWVATPRRDGSFAQALPMDDSLAAFQALYEQFVVPQWTVERVSRPSETDYAELNYPELRAVKDTQSLVNRQPHDALVWPDSATMRRDLWGALSQEFAPNSLLLGAARKRDILDSPFLNGTASDVSSKVMLTRAQPKPVARPPMATPNQPPGQTRQRAADMRDTRQGAPQNQATLSGPPTAYLLRLQTRYDRQWLREFVTTMRKLKYEVNPQAERLADNESVFQADTPRTLLIHWLYRTPPSQKDMMGSLYVDAEQSIAAAQVPGQMDPNVAVFQLDGLRWNGRQAAERVCEYCQKAAQERRTFEDEERRRQEQFQRERLQMQGDLEMQTRGRRGRGTPDDSGRDDGEWDDPPRRRSFLSRFL